MGHLTGIEERIALLEKEKARQGVLAAQALVGPPALSLALVSQHHGQALKIQTEIDKLRAELVQTQDATKVQSASAEPTVAQCEAAIAHYQRHLRALMQSLTEGLDQPLEGPERERQTQVARNAVRLIEFQLETTKRELCAAREREGL